MGSNRRDLLKTAATVAGPLSGLADVQTEPGQRDLRAPGANIRLLGAAYHRILDHDNYQNLTALLDAQPHPTQLLE